MVGFGENVGSGFPKIIAAWKETNWGEPQLMNKLDVDEVELVLPVPSVKSSTSELSNGFSIGRSQIRTFLDNKEGFISRNTSF